MPTLYIIRGHSGSGKSTLARTLVTKPFHFEADMFFIDNDGIYRFRPDQLKEAHAWCLESVKGAMKSREDIVVSNTFIRWQVTPYLKLTRSKGYTSKIILCTGQFENIHGVPEATVQRQKNTYEPLHFEKHYPEPRKNQFRLGYMV